MASKYKTDASSANCSSDDESSETCDSDITGHLFTEIINLNIKTDEEDAILNTVLDDIVKKLKIQLNPLEKFQTISEIRKLILTTEKINDKIIASDVLSSIVNCLTNDDQPNLQVEAIWILINIIAGSAIQTLAVVELGAIGLLVRLLSSPHIDIQEQSLWAQWQTI